MVYALVVIASFWVNGVAQFDVRTVYEYDTEEECLASAERRRAELDELGVEVREPGAMWSVVCLKMEERPELQGPAKFP